MCIFMRMACVHNGVRTCTYTHRHIQTHARTDPNSLLNPGRPAALHCIRTDQSQPDSIPLSSHRRRCVAGQWEAGRRRVLPMQVYFYLLSCLPLVLLTCFHLYDTTLSLFSAEAMDKISAVLHDPSKKSDKDVVPCYDPGTMQLLGHVPAMSTNEVCVPHSVIACGWLLSRSNYSLRFGNMNIDYMLPCIPLCRLRTL